MGRNTPDLGADENGFHFTTNERSFFQPEFKVTQIYAFSKSTLASGAAVVTVTQFDRKLWVVTQRCAS